MDKASEAFFREGVSRYAEAYATVSAFEELAAEKVAEVVRSRTGGLRGKSGKVEPVANNVCNGELGGRVAYAYFFGKWHDQKPKWEIGLWWEKPSRGKKVVVYLECVDGPDVLCNGSWTEVPGGEPGTWEAWKSGMHLELEPGADVDAAFQRLIDVVERQLKKVGT